MAVQGCYCKRDCTFFAIVVSAILGIVTAFLQISGTITVTPVALWVALGIAVVYLAALVVSTLVRAAEQRCCCRPLGAVLTGALGTVLFAAVLLVVGITATSVVSAILVGLLSASFALTVTATACLVRCAAGCAD